MKDFKKAYNSVRKEVLYKILKEFGIPMKLVRLIKMRLNKTYSKAHIGKHLSDTFSCPEWFKEMRCFITIALEYAIKNVHETQVGLKLNGTHQLLAYDNDMNLLGYNIETTKKNIETLTDASKEVGLEVHEGKTKYTLVSSHQNAGQNREMKIAKRSSGNVSQFKYLGMTVTNQNLIQEEFKRRFNSGNGCYHSVSRTFCPLICCQKCKG
jgi:hypothetical protein